MERQYRIICFGDSITWGYDPDNRVRFPEDIRWTGVMQEILGKQYKVIEEGQNGRTIATDDPAEGEKNGLKYILPCMESQSPFDLIIIMLGSNDLKGKFAYCPMDIAGEMQIFLEKVKSYIHFRMQDRAKILLVSPPHLGEHIESSWLGESFDMQLGLEKSKELAGWYIQLAQMYDTEFLDAAEYVQASLSDSCHLDAENQQKLGAVMAEKVKQISMER